MSKARLDGIYLLVLGSALFLLLGTAVERTHAASYGMEDFKAIYFGAKCVLQHCDPYARTQFVRVFEAAGETFPSDPAAARSVSQAIPICINLPTSLFVIAPFTFLPLGLAELLWGFLTAGLLILAGFFVWTLVPDTAATTSGALIALLIAGSELLLLVGNAAGVVVSLCVIAACCLVRQRFVWAGVLCLAISLVIKPQDGCLVWLYFLLAGGIYRKRALQSLVVTAALVLPAVLWVAYVSPHWMQELHANLRLTSVRGGLNDPGPSSLGGHGLGMVISLQALISMYRDDARIYNPISWLVCGLLLLVWIVRTLRSRATSRSSWFALASIAALSMLPVYHRSYDARLLLLAIPACAIVWLEKKLAGWCALLLTAVAILLTGDLFWAFFFILADRLHFSNHLAPWTMDALQVFPAPLILLVASLFYLWIYLREKPRALEADV